MKIVKRTRVKVPSGYHYANIATDGQQWRFNRGLVQPGYGWNRESHVFKTQEAAEKQYTYWLDFYKTVK